MKSIQNNDASASHVTPCPRGRRPTLTPERVEKILQFVAEGDTEFAAAIRAGSAPPTWYSYKRRHPSVQACVDDAKAQAAAKRYEAHKAALREAYILRAANRRPRSKKSSATKQARVVLWMLIYRVPLNIPTIPEPEIRRACE